MGRKEDRDYDSHHDHNQNDNSVDEQQKEEVEEDTQVDFDEALVCSGQTEDERRKIRVKQRKLRSEISDIDVDEARDKNNSIFKKVRYIREAVLDSENFDEIAKKAAAKVEQIIKVPRYDADRVVSKLIEKCQARRGGSSYFDWHALGVQAGICFNAPPSHVSFLNGPLLDGKEEIQVKKRTKRTHQKMSPEEANAKEERPDDIQGHTARGADQLSAVEQNICDVSDAVKRKVDKTYIANKKKLKEKYGSSEKIPSKVAKKLRKNTGVCAVELLFNPKSFTQTVENLFHYSFLVKKGDAVFSVRDKKVVADGVLELDGGPVVKPVRHDEGKSPPPPPRQAIVSLTMKDWRDLIEAYDVKESDVPHREGSIYEKRTSTK